MQRSASATAQRIVGNDGRRRVVELGPKFTFLKVIIPDVDIHFVSVFLFFPVRNIKKERKTSGLLDPLIRSYKNVSIPHTFVSFLNAT